MDSEDVIKIVENFSGFAKLILKLEQKRQQNKETTA